MYFTTHALKVEYPAKSLKDDRCLSDVMMSCHRYFRDRLSSLVSPR